MTLEARFAASIEALLGEQSVRAIGVAVSGGGDSTALMHLAADWATARGVEVFAVTVDHGLRPEAAAEARAVRRQADALGIAHATIRWAGWDGEGNLQDAARRARRGLLYLWSFGLDHVLMGHTMEDQAETVLRNLARGSGVAGLSGMAGRCRLPEAAQKTAIHDMDGAWPEFIPKGTLHRHRPDILRPLLEMRRQELRDWLRARGIGWADDPSNEDERFARVRARKALAQGNALGLSVEGLAETARRQRRARRALERMAQVAAREIARVQHGDVVFEREGLLALEAETRFHLVAHALKWVASAEHRPRLRALEAALASALAGRAATLHGCVLRPGGGSLRVHREWKAVAACREKIRDAVPWDGRWRVRGWSGSDGHAVVRAAGEAGLRQARALEPGVPIPADLPADSLRAAPAVFSGETLLALPPFAGPACGLTLAPAMGGFEESLLSR